MVCEAIRHHFDGFLYIHRKEDAPMAKTKTSVRGVQQKKIVVVKTYKRADGTRVPEHRRSTPN